jgi:hypothetical protein
MEEQQRGLRELSSPLPITSKTCKKIASSSPLSTKPVPKMSTTSTVKAFPLNPSVGLVPQIGKPLADSYNPVTPFKPRVILPGLQMLKDDKNLG